MFLLHLTCSIETTRETLGYSTWGGGGGGERERERERERRKVTYSALPGPGGCSWPREGQSPVSESLPPTQRCAAAETKRTLTRTTLAPSLTQECQESAPLYHNTYTLPMFQFRGKAWRARGCLHTWTLILFGRTELSLSACMYKYMLLHLLYIRALGSRADKPATP